MDSLLIPAATGNPPKVAPGTNIASTVASDGSTVFVYYQNTTGGILESQFDGRTWTGGASSPALFQAAPYTPLAAINWDNGDQRRIYYLDERYTIQEFCYVSGTWKLGQNFKVGYARATPHTSLAAFCIVDPGPPGVRHLRVYYQTADSLNIQEICSDGGVWQPGMTFRPALDGTRIAAVAYNVPTLTLAQVYCQSNDLTLRQHSWDGHKWNDGSFAPGAAPACTPIATLGWGINANGTQLVHWKNADRKFTQAAYSTQSQEWAYNDAIFGGTIPNYTKIATCQSTNGGTARLYYQIGDASILETQSDAGAGWSKGSYIQAG